jgi:PIN domain nuclease of toxin-antitoxin system
LLAFLNDEPGAAAVEAELPRAAVSSVNLSEAATVLVEHGADPVEVRTLLDGLGLDVIPFDANLAYRAAALRPATRPFGLSLGDRACLALAEHLEIAVLTADKSWRRLKTSIEIRLIR